MGRKISWHSGTLECYDLEVANDLTVDGNFSFGDASTDSLSVSGVLKLASGGSMEATLDGSSSVGGTITLAGGTQTVTTSAVEDGDVVLLSNLSAGGTIGVPSVDTIAGGSFTINSLEAGAQGSVQSADTSVIAWFILGRS